MPVWIYSRKPGSDTSSLYGPIGRFGKVYDPVSSVIAVRFAPVSVRVTEISAPGRTAPVWSFTVPLICEVETDCATKKMMRATECTLPPPCNAYEPFHCLPAGVPDCRYQVNDVFFIFQAGVIHDAIADLSPEHSPGCPRLNKEHGILVSHNVFERVRIG